MESPFIPLSIGSLGEILLSVTTQLAVRNTSRVTTSNCAHAVIRLSGNVPNCRTPTRGDQPLARHGILLDQLHAIIDVRGGQPS